VGCLVCAAAPARAQLTSTVRVTNVVGTPWTGIAEALEPQVSRLARCGGHASTTTFIGTIRVGVDARGRAVAATVDAPTFDARTVACASRVALGWQLPPRGVTYVVTAHVTVDVVAPRRVPELQAEVETAPLLGRRSPVAVSAGAPGPASSAQATVGGTSHPAPWLAVIRRSRPALARCSATPGAWAVVEVDTDRRGRVREALVIHMGGLSLHGMECIQATLRSLRFPRSRAGVVIVQPIFY